VGASGNVTEATLEAGGSRYFGRLALEAARQWQFAPVEGAGPRKWILRFEIMRTATEVIPLRADGNSSYTRAAARKPTGPRSQVYGFAVLFSRWMMAREKAGVHTLM